MSIGSSMNAGVLGLQANATRMSTIADNIANAGTVGYKRADVQFMTLVTGGGEGSAFAAGGVNTTVRREISRSGLIESTEVSTDIAIKGRGFLPVRDTLTPGAIDQQNDASLFTKAGSFRPDKDGYLRNAAGMYLQGWPLNPDGTRLTDFPARDTFGALETVNVSNFASSASATNQITYAGNLPADAAAGETFVQPLEYYDPLGRSERLNLEFTKTATPNEWTLEAFDLATAAPTSLGTVTLTFNDAPPIAGSLSAAAPPAPPYNTATGRLELTTAAGNPINISLGRPDQLGGLTQFAGGFEPSQIIKDGTPVGALVGAEINEKGVVEAILSNGQRQPIYQVPIVDVVNENQLEPVDGNAFALSADSGGFYLWDAGAGPVGQPLGYALEASTTDIARELTSLIETQRAYSSNAKIIQTADEMLQETTNLKR